MPRKQRIRSETGMYHLRDIGINHQNLFDEKQDKLKYKYILQDAKEETDVEIIAYCLMNNHIHLLIKGEPEQISTFERLSKGRYAQWYNDKYERSGPLFDGRYKTKNIKDINQIFAVLKYIHFNPLVAGLVKSVDEYEFSSYNCYLGKKDDFVDRGYILDEIDETEFIAMHLKITDDKEHKINSKKPHMNDEKAIKILLGVAGVQALHKIQNLPLEFRKLVLAEVQRKGLAVRQICRLTGITKYQIEKSKK